MENKGKDIVVAYYDEIASTYDESRFGNSYGRFIDAQERIILDQLFPPDKPEQRLEIACGTGRLTGYATHGLDASAEMLAQARERYGDVIFVEAFADDTGFTDASFDAVYTFHLLMHLEPSVIAGIFREVHRILKPGGRFIFDIPSKKRRKLLRHHQASWHGGTELSSEDVCQLCGSEYSLRRSFGLLFLPVHKLPAGMRSRLVQPDFRLANGWMKENSSYLAFELIKR
ncbi:MAG: class I SAM-dependent methyltransferase [Oscillospiraceae bacterium]|nr:class I SAM-dependent methyltransferase [Oscillospiraceae bacterium]